MKLLALVCSVAFLMAGAMDAEARSKRGKSAKAKKRSSVVRVVSRPKAHRAKTTRARPVVVIAPSVTVRPAVRPAARPVTRGVRSVAGQCIAGFAPPQFTFPPASYAFCCNGSFDMARRWPDSCREAGGTRFYRN
jgi:hypothetical protein